MIEFAKGLLAVATYLVAFFALPAWYFWFTMNITAFFPEWAQKKASQYMGLGAVWLMATLWMVWRYVLPDWWVEAVLHLTN